VALNEIQLIDVDPATRRVFFVLKPKRLKGINKLVQIVVLSLLNVAGRDALDPEKGGGLPSLVGSNIDPNDSTEVFGEIARRVRKSEKEIVDAQIGLNEDPEENLTEIQIVKIQNGDNDDEIFVRLRVINEVGRATELVV